MKSPHDQLHEHYVRLKKDIARIGIREVARRIGTNPMRVSRFASGHGSNDALVLYLVASACGYTIYMKDGGPCVDDITQVIGSRRPSKAK
jgi:transcriptional regulator with XRE-family HTH domain